MEYIIKVYTEPTNNGLYMWTINEYDAEFFGISQPVAVGTENSLEEAFAAALKRYKEMESNEPI